MAAPTSVPDWKGSLARLRKAGCPFLEPVLRGHMPQDAVLVLDHNSLSTVQAATMEALTGAGYKNELIVPELALDYFDANAKTSSKVVFQARESAEQALTDAAASPLLPEEFINLDRLNDKKKVLLRRDTYRVTVQRVDQYDRELLTTLGIPANSYDTRLYVLCALYFKKKLQRPTVIFTSDDAVIELAAEYDIMTCPAEEICHCGRLIADDAEKKKTPPPPPPPAPAPTSQGKQQQQNQGSRPQGGTAKGGAKATAPKKNGKK